MNDAEYRALAEALYQSIEEAIDSMVEAYDLEMDYENSGGVLTIFMEESSSQVIISRQAATQQIWVAAKSGGFHCIYDNADWICTKTNESIQALLSRTCSEQSSRPITFPDLQTVI